MRMQMTLVHAFHNSDLFCNELLIRGSALEGAPHYFIPSFGAIENEDLIIADVTNEIF